MTDNIYFYLFDCLKKDTFGTNILEGMKILQVPFLSIPLEAEMLNKMKILHEAGSEAFINQVNWKTDFPDKMPVSVRAAHDGDRLYLHYLVSGEAVRAVTTEDFGAVWKDSCVEFFMQREGDTIYRNFECNVLGALLAAKRINRESAEKLTEDAASIVRLTTIRPYYQNGRQVTDWSLWLEIPKKAMGFDTHETLSEQKIRANFYKCGDETPQPHYLSWSPIDTPSPDFHVPQFFGLLQLD